MTAKVGQPCDWTGKPDPDSDFVLEQVSLDGSFLMIHRGGVPWHEAPVPPRRHTCQPQTVGWTGYFNQVFRCACGAISNRPNRDWDERNSRQPAPVAMTTARAKAEWYAIASGVAFGFSLGALVMTVIGNFMGCS